MQNHRIKRAGGGFRQLEAVRGRENIWLTRPANDGRINFSDLSAGRNSCYSHYCGRHYCNGRAAMGETSADRRCGSFLLHNNKVVCGKRIGYTRNQMIDGSRMEF